MSDDPQLRVVIGFAFRHFSDADTTDAERDAILCATSEHLGGSEGELAARILHHRREARALQLELGLTLNPAKATQS